MTVTAADVGSIETNATAAPCVKWAGGKTKLLPTILPIVTAALAGSKEAVYHEPFVGGGAVFFALAARRFLGRPLHARIADVNPEQERLGVVPDRAVRGYQTLLREHKRRHTAEGDVYYYAQRAKVVDPSTQVVEAAARFIYLNRTCFNGLYRVNRARQFNVPVGKYANPRIVDEEGLGRPRPRSGTRQSPDRASTRRSSGRTWATSSTATRRTCRSTRGRSRPGRWGSTTCSPGREYPTMNRVYQVSS